MPAIGTSSDQYQHRDPALTTYRKNRAAPTLADAMAQRPDDKTRAAALERRQGEVRALPEAGAIGGKVAVNDAAPREAVTPPKVVHELYAPPSRVRREHDDRHAMVTGGTVDVRA